MDNFEYSIQLNDRDWAEFLRAVEECNQEPAALATAEEQCLSDIEQGDGVPAPCSTRAGIEPGLGKASCSPHGLCGEDEVDLCSSILREGKQPVCPLFAAMPSVQGRQPPHPPAAEGTAGQDAASGEGAAGSGAMEHPEHPAAPCAQGEDAGMEQPCGSPAVAQGGAQEITAWKSHAEVPGPTHEHPAAELGEKAGSQPSVLEVVRPKVPASARKSRKQRGVGGTEVTPGDKEPAGSPARGSTASSRAPSSSPLTSRKGKGKEKAAKAAPMRLSSEEAAESKRPTGSPGVELGGVSPSMSPKLKAKESGEQSPGKARATKLARQVGGTGACDTVPVVVTPPDTTAVVVTPSVVVTTPDATPVVVTTPVVVSGLGELCQEGKALGPQSVAAAAAGGCRDFTASPPRVMGSPTFAVGGSPGTDTLDVTWPEMYDYLFCESQGEEEAAENAVEGEKTPLEREISLPELYEYFFNEPEGSRKKAKRKDRKRKEFFGLHHAELQKEDPEAATAKEPLVATVPELYEHFFPDRPQHRGGWRGFLFSSPASEVKKAVGALMSILQRPKPHSKTQAPTSPSLARRGSHLALVPVGGGPEYPPALDMALALRGRPEAPLALTHKDMCLVFCAFASWAVKTSDLQAPDAWKTVFLASFGTLSAIRYFRRQVREGRPRT
ncbi:PGC-1 and ERR-induced regulator in muscle protein 1 [Meleagris gallopavo]|uniref:PGC-1 and ERR-induced regulator in muscle protein 1 n=1 Tax=Meleagris gallopavo TaxID=9103 RepID=UPI000549B247|nr:PGC-1 and ERR-induced regulator in muscle protein 1 [Meleagris gallopavo]